jgi:hypothetical protein
MNRLPRLLLLLLFVFADFSGANAQGSGVHTEYLKNDKTTQVETNFLYVFDTVDQFVTIKLRTIYKGDHLTKLPTEVFLDIFSVSNRPLYRNDPLVAIADGVTYRLGSLYDTVLRGETNNAVESFFIVDTSLRFGVNVPVPQTAQIRAGRNLSGKTMEWLGITIKTEQFLKLANATKLEWLIKTSTFTLDDRQLDIVHNFAKQITP